MTCLKDTFKVVAENDGGKLFDNVSRFKCENTHFTVFVDVNIDLFPLKQDDSVDILLTTTLNRDNKPMTQKEYSLDFGKGTLMEDYDYVMHGIIFKFVEDKEESKVAVIISFGGLLLMVHGKQSDLKNFHMDDNVYLLMKKN